MANKRKFDESIWLKPHLYVTLFYSVVTMADKVPPMTESQAVGKFSPNLFLTSFPVNYRKHCPNNEEQS